MAIAQDSTHPTGVSSDGDDDGVEILRARNRKANAAIQMVAMGAEWDEVAQVLGFPTGRIAKVAVERQLEKDFTESDKKILRELGVKKLNMLLKSVMPKALNDEAPDHLPYNKRASELVAQWTRLLGLDAPTEMVIYNPTAEEIERWVAATVQTQVPELEQSDIFDAEIVEDE